MSWCPVCQQFIPSADDRAAVDRFLRRAAEQRGDPGTANYIHMSNITLEGRADDVTGISAGAGIVLDGMTFKGLATGVAVTEEGHVMSKGSRFVDNLTGVDNSGTWEEEDESEFD